MVHKRMSSKETTRLSYEATAQAYANNVASLAPTQSIEKLMSVLLPNPRILDIGCGSGRDALIFQGMEAEVTGIDFCNSLLEIAKANAPLVDFQLMDIEDMDFPDETFDAAWAACSLAHIPKASLPKVLKNIHRILEEEGYFYLALKKGTGERVELDERYEGTVQKFWAYYEADELKKFLYDAGFNILAFDLIEKSSPYQTHDAFRVFCKK